MLYQLSYVVKSVRVFDISELNLAPSVLRYQYVSNMIWILLCCVIYSGVEYVVCCYSECISHTRQSWKISLTTVGIQPATFGLLVQCSTNWATRSSRFECLIFRNLIWSSSFDISMFLIWYEFYCCVMYSGVEYVVCCYSECISHTRQAEKSAWPRWESNPRPLVC